MSYSEKLPPEIIYLREGINSIDVKLVELLNLRMDYCKKVGQLKHEANISQVYDSEREKAIIDKLSEISKYPAMVESIWPSIMLYSKYLQAQEK